MDHVNVCRILFYIEKRIRQRERERSFEWKTLEERFTVHEQCNIEVLEDVKSRKVTVEWCTDSIGHFALGARRNAGSNPVISTAILKKDFYVRKFKITIMS